MSATAFQRRRRELAKQKELEEQQAEVQDVQEEVVEEEQQAEVQDVQEEVVEEEQQAEVQEEPQQKETKPKKKSKKK
jgi:hypothetical protein